MNQHLQTIINSIQQSEHLSDEEKTALLKAAKDANKELEITSFKLDRTEKVKRTTAILLEETIEELEQKRKAVEAQNKELEIEAALEKVRSRSLEMHKSDELNDVVTVLFEKLKELKIPVTAVGIQIYIPGSKDMNAYVCGENENGLVISNYRLPYFEHIISNDLNNAREKQMDFFVGNYSRKEKNSFYNSVLELSSLHLPDGIKNLIFESPTYTISLATAKNSMLAINDFEGKILSENETDILIRFSKVFEQSYIRFLDLQKAEAQARESQIQLALERARTQSMMMQHSKELDDTLRVFHEQVLRLNIPSAFSFLWLPDEEKDRHIFWAAWAENNSFKSKAVNYPLDRNEPATAQCLIDWKGNEPVVSYHVPPDGVAIYFAAWNELIAGVEQLKPEYFSDGLYYVEAFMKYGCFGVMVKNILPEDEKKILSRFAVEFERAYTRFLDLQKAEAQSRESQIQLALERVRARTMAMQRSDELQEAASLIFQQIEFLGAPTWNCSFNIWTEDKKYAVAWNATKEGFGRPFYSPSSEDVFLEFYTAAQQGKELFIKEIGGQELEQHYQYLSAVPGVGETIAELKAAGIALPTFQIFNIAYFTQGYLMFITYKPVPELWDIFKRFAKVFEQTYTRFLDLQKAEAQAREAKIEAALENVRSSSLAMHRSDQLKSVATVMFKKWMELGLSLTGAFIFLYDKETRNLQAWIATTALSQPVEINTPYSPDIAKNQIFKDEWSVFETGKEIFNRKYSGKMKNDFFRYVGAYNNYPQEVKDFQLKAESWIISIAGEKHCAVGFDSWNGQLATIEDYKILKRFARTFEQAYIRFLDLQKAEAQARESQIQLALERVRARTMAMQHSNELVEASQLLDEQVRSLGIETWGCAFHIYNREDKPENELWDMEWFSSVNGILTPYKTPREKIFKKYFEKGQEGETLYIQEIGPDQIEAHYEYLKSIPVIGDALKAAFASGVPLPKSQIDHVAFFEQGHLLFITYKPVPEDHNIFIRFAKVFEQTYTRFLDLQKSEIQTRESQIQLALERVRARTMAMHKSEELAETSAEVFQQIKELGFETWSCGFCIWTKNDMAELWMGADSGGLLPPMFIPYKEEPTHAEIYQSYLNGEKQHDRIWEGDELKKHYSFLKTIPSVKEAIDVLEKSGLTLPPRQCYYVGFFNQGYLLLITKEPNAVLKDLSRRFAIVFEQTYTRFLDLQKAEAQSRESQIQLALERVRARTMAMQHSDELTETANLLFKQVQLLDLPVVSCGFNIWQKEDKVCNAYMSDEAGLIQPPFKIPLTESPVFIHFAKSKQKEESFYEEEISGEALAVHYKYMLSIPVFAEIANNFLKAGFTFPEFQINNVANFAFGNLIFITYKAVPEAHDIFKRFGKTFEQTYTRFLDLQKAESQARESQIETALERVRAIAMSMMKSDELMAVCEAVFKQLQTLGFEDVRAAQIYIRNDAEEKFLNYDYSDITGADVVEVGYNSHPNTRRIYDVIKNAGDALIDNAVTKDELDAWKSYLCNTLKQPPEKSLDAATELHYYLYSIGTGAFGICTFKTMSHEELQILKRFRNVFSLSYQRYTDMALAEAQAREAKIEAALERVRSRTLAMQKSDELAETSAVLFKQLIGLGIAPNRLYIGVIHDESGNIEFWITDEDGSKVSTMFSGDAYNNLSMKKMYDGWQKQEESIIIDMHGKELADYFHYLGEELHVPFKDGLSQKRRLQYISYFSKGFIGMASPDEQPKETIDLLERFAYVFNLTFTRFNDLKIAEAHAIQAEEDLIKLQTEKRRAEDALIELRAAQKQLVQSEKMASLGELTAGIAHEIQNPLNFVNNFSEVSKELLDEMKAALESGHEDDAKEIANDIIQNLEKINQHGKRADAIVKSMLQHSRSSSATKKPTDINALIDEYIRLCYHGLRAKDSSFNAAIKTDFDNTIEQINIIPQDIGRVVLNVLTNAFYAVNEKKKAPALKEENYEPTVSVTTKRISTPSGKRALEIKISDNGNGIPQNIIDKIFQPFFTAKPTGQGTGLGLSLSYDIIKAHGGEIKVQTKENEGSEFVIQLPNS